MTNAEARFNNSLRPRKPEGSLGRTAQDDHLDFPTAPELWGSRPSSAFRFRRPEADDNYVICMNNGAGTRSASTDSIIIQIVHRHTHRLTQL